MIRFEELNERNSTIIEVKATTLYGKYGEESGNVELRTTADPVVSDDGKTYTATAVDVFDNKYAVTWEVKDFETTDESNACDWNSPVSIEAIL